MVNLFIRPKNVHSSQLKWVLLMLKRFFETGYALTNYVKYMIALFGLSSLNVSKTMILAVIYAFFCFVIGYLWHRYNFATVESEVGNLFNPFYKEVRNSINGEK